MFGSPETNTDRHGVRAGPGPGSRWKFLEAGRADRPAVRPVRSRLDAGATGWGPRGPPERLDHGTGGPDTTLVRAGRRTQAPGSGRIAGRSVVPGSSLGPPDSGRNRPCAALETASLVALRAVCLGNHPRAKPHRRQTAANKGFCPRHTGNHSERMRRMVNRACVEMLGQRETQRADAPAPGSAGIEAGTGGGGGSSGRMFGSPETNTELRGAWSGKPGEVPGSGAGGSSSPASTGRRGREAARPRQAPWAGLSDGPRRRQRSGSDRRGWQPVDAPAGPSQRPPDRR